MFKQFFPNEYVASTYVIPFEKLYEKGYRAIIFDIDNTLVPHGAKADKRSKELFERLRELGFSCCVMSNNKEQRVKSFYDEVDVDGYIYDAHKPAIRNYHRAMNIMQSNIANTVFVGDQLFTDILGAKRSGMHGILVKPIHPSEEIQIVLKRYLEKIVLHFYKKQRK